MTEAWTTRPDPLARLDLDRASPSLLFHKWHDYDLEAHRSGKYETEKTRIDFLRRVAKRVAGAAAGEPCLAWRRRYDDALAALDHLHRFEATTVWRLVAGLATNPALETGLHLHPMYGVPYLPGSTVKGLVHAAAEWELGETSGLEKDEILDQPEALAGFLSRARRIRDLFGSLVLEPGTARVGEKTRIIGPSTPLTHLKRWLKETLPPDDPRRAPIASLLVHTGGRLRFYDSLPAADQHELLDVDLLNPHYPDYYRSEGEHPPSDDQNPTPVYFLAVRPETRFVFPVRFAPLRESRRPKADAGEEPPELDAETSFALVGRWLARGLTELGAGGKTAAGYGYFDLGEGFPEGAGRIEAEAAEGEGGQTGCATTGTNRAKSERTIWPGATLQWIPNESQLTAKSEGETAWAKGKALLEQLPGPVRKKLEVRHKLVTWDVEVRRPPEGGIEIVALLGNDHANSKTPK